MACWRSTIKANVGVCTRPTVNLALYIVSHLIKQNDTIICATDAGREGQLIFEYVYRMSTTDEAKTVKRLWISSMTDEAIKDGLKHLII